MNFKEILQKGREAAETAVADAKKAIEESTYAKLHNRVEEVADAVVSLAKAVHVMTRAVHRHEQVLQALVEQQGGLDEAKPKTSSPFGFPSLKKKETSGPDKPN